MNPVSFEVGGGDVPALISNICNYFNIQAQAQPRPQGVSSPLLAAWSERRRTWSAFHLAKICSLNSTFSM